MSDLCEVVIMAPDPDWLYEMSRQLVEEGLCASVHHFGMIRSIYRWHGEVVERTEGRASLHTRTALVEQIVERVKAGHSYEVPGVSARPIIDGNPDYLRWMRDETNGTNNPRLRPPCVVKRPVPALCLAPLDVRRIGPA